MRASTEDLTAALPNRHSTTAAAHNRLLRRIPIKRRTWIAVRGVNKPPRFGKWKRRHYDFLPATGYRLSAEGFGAPVSEFFADLESAKRGAFRMAMELSLSEERLVRVTIGDSEGKVICQVPDPNQQDGRCPPNVRDRSAVERHLALAERHVAAGSRIVARQHDMVGKLTTNGRNTGRSRNLLALFEDVLRLHISDRDRLRRELGASAGAG